MKIADLPWGWIGTYGDNEIEVVSTIGDPPKVRLAVPSDRVESNLGLISFNLRRADGVHEEYGSVGGRLTPDKLSGALYLAVRAVGEQQPKEVLYIDSTVALFRVPVIMPNSTRRVALRSEANGKFVCAENAGNEPLIANRDAVGQWEMFELREV